MKSNNTLIILGIFLSVYLAIKAFFLPEPQHLTCVDGDTFAINDKFYRLSYVDTPEKGEPLYEEASFYTCYIMSSRQFNLKNHGKDIYNRQLVEVFFYNTSTSSFNLSLNELLIKEGYAIPYYSNTTDKILELYNKL